MTDGAKLHAVAQIFGQTTHLHSGYQPNLRCLRWRHWRVQADAASTTLKTGKLTQLTYDRNGNGVIDTWTDMDGAKPLRSRIDLDENGTIDRWEYYGPDQKLEKVGFSRMKDGKEDAWSFAGPDGSVARIEVSTRRDGKVSRIEHL